MRPLSRRIVLSVAVLFAGSVGVRATGAQPATQATRILILYAPAPDSPTSAVFIERFRATMRAELPPPVEFYEEFLDLDRFPGPERWPQLARYFRDKYHGEDVDLVVAVGSVALRFAVDRLREILRGTPIVFGMTYEHQVDVAELPANVTGRTIGVTLGATLTMAHRLQPDADRVVVIAGASAVDSVAMSGALADAAAPPGGIRVVRWQGLPYDSLLGALRGLSPRTIVFFAHLRRDGHGRTLVPMEIMPEIVRHSGAPVYSYVDKLMGTGVVGGAMIRHDDEATRTALLAVRVLRRDAGIAMPPVERSRAEFMADWRELRRWKLDPNRLVPGTELLFRAPTAWERYRGAILAGFGIIVVESLLIGLLLVERRRRIRVQRALADQADYERMIAGLMTDLARHAPEDAPRALGEVIARLGRYVDADDVVLVQHADRASRSALRVEWARGDRSGTLKAQGAPASGQASGAPLEFPLVVAGKALGRLTLSRAGPDRWRPHLVERLSAAADVIAGAIARSSAALRAEEAGRQVAHMGRVAMIGELAATISHELRQPLAAIRINAELGKRLIARNPVDAEEVRQVLEDIVAYDIGASDVIDHIRSLLRKEVPAITEVDLNAVCREAVDLVRRDAGSRGIRLDLSLVPRRPLVAGHAIEFQQVVLNLLLNALDAAGVSSGERWVAVGTTALEGHVELVVRDSGPGLAPETRERIFESFFTTKVHGLGIGLVIARSIVERHRGRIEAENGALGGAIFRVRLPILDNPRVAATPRGASPGDGSVASGQDDLSPVGG